MTEQGSTDHESSEGDVGTDTTTERSDASADVETGAAETSEHEGEETQEAVTGADADGHPSDDVDEQLVERVDDADPATIAREIAAHRVEIEGAEAELADREETIDDLESKLARARADFQNYKKRTEKRRAEAVERSKADLVDRLLGVHDNLSRALDQDEDVDIRDGVESTLQQFDDALAAEDVGPIDPAGGDEVDPHRHEVLVRVESEHPEGTIDDVHRVGYEMGDTIVREAQVTVSEGSDATGAGDSDENSTAPDDASAE